MAIACVSEFRTLVVQEVHKDNHWISQALERFFSGLVGVFS